MSGGAGGEHTRRAWALFRQHRPRRLIRKGARVKAYGDTPRAQHDMSDHDMVRHTSKHALRLTDAKRPCEGQKTLCNNTPPRREPTCCACVRYGKYAIGRSCRRPSGHQIYGVRTVQANDRAIPSRSGLVTSWPEATRDKKKHSKCVSNRKQTPSSGD